MAGEDTKIYTRLPEVQFATRDIAPPSALYVHQDDVLVVRAWSGFGASLRIKYRLLLADGRIVPGLEQMVVPNTRAPTTRSFRLAEGFLLSVVIDGMGWAQMRGAVYAQMDLYRQSWYSPNESYAQLICGYVDGRMGLAWPSGRSEYSTAGRGWIRSITGTDPAANTEFTEVVPTGAVWRVLSVSATLVTSAVVATRYPTLIFDDGVQVLYRVADPTGQPAAQTERYSWAPAVGAPSAAAAVHVASLPSDLYLLTGWRIRSWVINRDVGDDWSAPQLTVEEFIGTWT